MKNYIKLVVIALFAAVTSLSAQQSTPFDNRLPEIWQADMSNVSFKKPINIRSANQRYTPTEFSKGRSYDILNTNNKINTPSSTTLQNNNSSSYYRSYGINHNTTQNVTYNAPTQMEQLTINTAESTPFGDVISTGDIMRVDRDNKPKDPAPLSDVAIPLLLIAGVYVAIKLKAKC